MKTLFLTAVSGFFLSSCVAPSSDAPARVIAEKSDQPGGTSVQFRSVDGTPVKHLEQIRLDPGPHRLVLGAYRNVATAPMSKLGLPGSTLGAGLDDFRALRTSQGMTLIAKPNTTYRARINAAHPDNPVFWIEEAATGEIVAQSGR